jgi:hypothetical protein
MVPLVNTRKSTRPVAKAPARRNGQTLARRLRLVSALNSVSITDDEICNA